MTAVHAQYIRHIRLTSCMWVVYAVNPTKPTVKLVPDPIALPYSYFQSRSQARKWAKHLNTLTNADAVSKQKKCSLIHRVGRIVLYTKLWSVR